MMKKMAAIILSVVTVFSATGCSMLQGTFFLMKMRQDAATEEARIMEPGNGGKTGLEMSMDADEMVGGEWEVYECEAYMPEMPQPQWNTEEYKYVAENGWLSSITSPFSTFAADVDTASYANVRRMILEGQTVPADAVRIEEMINYFDYHYPAPKGDEPFSVTTKIAPCPWNEDTQLFMIGLKAKEIKSEDRGEKGSNLVFLIDVSGSMDEYNKLPLVQRAFRLLINELDAHDRVSIVTYASEDRVVLDGADGSEKTLIQDAVEDLLAGGGTNGSDGIVTAYELAQKHFIEGGNNRVILATDGDLNIGLTDEGSLTRLIEEKAKSGVYLSVLGFGEGNISDTNMEALADHGNGNYSYIDNISEARKVLVKESGSTLFTVAKDVKLQVEFNPARVKGYRLIGYENRTMAAESFADDTKDGGEIGSGHTVTALYEIAPVGSGMEIPAAEGRYTNAGEQQGEQTGQADEWGVVHIRYKEPDADESTLIDTIVRDDAVLDGMDDDLSWAAGVAQAGMILKGSEYAGTTDLAKVRERLKVLTENDEFREEFVYLLGRMNSNTIDG